jgi:hypothetical protein
MPTFCGKRYNFSMGNFSFFKDFCRNFSILNHFSEFIFYTLDRFEVLLSQFIFYTNINELTDMETKVKERYSFQLNTNRQLKMNKYEDDDLPNNYIRILFINDALMRPMKVPVGTNIYDPGLICV